MKISYGQIVLLYCLLLGVVTQRQDSYYSINLTDWKYQVIGTQLHGTTKVPITLTDILQNQGIIDDPYYRDNFLKFYEYETKDIRFQTIISSEIADQCKSNKIQQIIFEGLDTHCDILLNEEQIMSVHNMYRRYVVNVEFKPDVDNLLTVRCNSSANFDIQQQEKFKNEFGFALPQNFSYSRKAAYQYGWDWGPRMLTVGIWKNVSVQCYDEIKISRISLQHSPIDYKNLVVEDIVVKADLIDLIPSKVYTVEIQITQNGISLYNQSKKALTFTQAHNFESNKFSFNKQQAQPLIWWTWDIGAPNLFNISLTVDGIRSKQIQTAFRTVKVIQNKDSVGNGTSFTVNLNGYDIFMRGGNYIPPAMSMSNLQQLIPKYQSVREQAIFAKFNMLRIWGGGQYQHDQFYTEMDRAGILIWHDLMFACAMYPIFGDVSTADNIKEEMRYNIGRIGHHPSIGLWNGNNEVWIGWQEWGWKKGLNQTQLKQAEDMYKKIFHETIPSVLSELTPNIFYWQTSPSSSSNSLSTLNSGDIHFWRVWGLGTPIQEYETYIGRFNSEYGMQSMPQFSSITKFTDEKDRTLNSLILRLHERHPKGDEYLPMYTNQTTGYPKDLKKYSYYTQIMQAYALETAIRSLRGFKPYCMGSLYWQLNDVWPVNSWSTVDYYGSYKAAHYRIRQLHNQLLGHVIQDSSTKSYKVYVVNDYLKKLNIYCQVRIIDFSGKILNYFVYEKSVDALDQIIIDQFAKSYLDNFDLTRTFLNIRIRTTGKQISENNYFFKTIKSRFLLFPDVSYSYKGNQFKIKTKYLANYVWVRYQDHSRYLHLNENYFDMLPNQQKTIILPNQIDPSLLEVTCYQCEAIKQQNIGQILQNIEKNHQNDLIRKKKGFRLISSR